MFRKSVVMLILLLLNGQVIAQADIGDTLSISVLYLSTPASRVLETGIVRDTSEHFAIVTLSPSEDQFKPSIAHNSTKPINAARTRTGGIRLARLRPARVNAVSVNKTPKNVPVQRAQRGSCCPPMKKLCSGKR